MPSADPVTHIEEHLASQLSGGEQRLFVPLLRELAKGAPLDPAVLSARVGVPPARLDELLAGVPVDRDDRGRIVGAGLTLLPTEHVFEIEGKRLFTWCALDALMFPTLLGLGARVTSPCATTGRLISMNVTPTEVLNVDPSTACVSLVPPRADSDVRSSFCVHVRFFATQQAARRWQDESGRRDAYIASVAEAHDLACASREASRKAQVAVRRDGRGKAHLPGAAMRVCTKVFAPLAFSCVVACAHSSARPAEQPTTGAPAEAEDADGDALAGWAAGGTIAVIAICCVTHLVLLGVAAGAISGPQRPTSEATPQPK